MALWNVNDGGVAKVWSLSDRCIDLKIWDKGRILLVKEGFHLRLNWVNIQVLHLSLYLLSVIRRRLDLLSLVIEHVLSNLILNLFLDLSFFISPLFLKLLLIIFYLRRACYLLLLKHLKCIHIMHYRMGKLIFKHLVI